LCFKNGSCCTYRYDDLLSPALEWDGQNAARERGEALIRQVLESKSLDEAKAVASKLKAMSKPFLNWVGKAQRLSLDVPTLPLFIHERLKQEDGALSVLGERPKGVLKQRGSGVLDPL
jgi:hypothetical protein